MAKRNALAKFRSATVLSANTYSISQARKRRSTGILEKNLNALHVFFARSSSSYAHEQIVTKINNPHITRKIFPSTSWISHPLILTLPNSTGSIQNIITYETSNPHNSLISQPKSAKRISELSTKYDLQDAYHNLSKGYGRNLTSWRWQCWIRAF
jgi:hypothetical protein